MADEMVIVWPAVPAAKIASSDPSEVKAVAVAPPSVVQLAVLLSHAPSPATFQVMGMPAWAVPASSDALAAKPIATARNRGFDFVCLSRFCILTVVVGLLIASAFSGTGIAVTTDHGHDQLGTGGQNGAKTAAPQPTKALVRRIRVGKLAVLSESLNISSNTKIGFRFNLPRNFVEENLARGFCGDAQDLLLNSLDRMGISARSGCISGPEFFADIHAAVDRKKGCELGFRNRAFFGES